eukprot:5553615-Pyramimonas_sp.AAC.1
MCPVVKCWRMVAVEVLVVLGVRPARLSMRRAPAGSLSRREASEVSDGPVVGKLLINRFRAIACKGQSHDASEI